MRKLPRTAALALLTLALAPWTCRAACPCNTCVNCGPDGLCRAPLTKSYRIEQGFCPQQIAAMIPQCVPAACADCCGPYGIPAVYAAGQYVLVRQTPEAHQRVAKYLAGLGAYIPRKPVQ